MIAGWIKLGAAAVAVASLLAALWIVSGWRVRAVEADRLEAELKTAALDLKDQALETERANLARATSDAMLLDAQDREKELSDELKRKVASIVPDNRSCDLGLDTVRLLNDARGHGRLPGPSRVGKGIPETFTKDTGRTTLAAAPD